MSNGSTVNKYEFIQQLLENKKLSPVQRERTFELAKEEIRKDWECNQTLVNRVEKLEEAVRSCGESISPEGNQTTKLKYPVIHDPRSTVEILKNFTESGSLKYTTHTWEAGKFSDFNHFMDAIKKEWDDISDKLKAQNPKLYAKIKNFLFNSKLGERKKDGYYHSWGKKNLKVGWSSPFLVSYITQAEDPFKCPIPPHIKKLEKNFDGIYFEDYINVFKDEIEFREDTNGFSKLFNDLWEKVLTYDFNIEFIETTGFSCFTDVPYFMQSAEIIFRESFKKRTEFPRIKILVTKNFEKSYLTVALIQIDSTCTRDIKDKKILYPSGTHETIIKNLTNLTDFSIVSRFPDDEIYQINYLSSSSEEQVTKLSDEIIEGFTYKFKFYM